MSPQDQIAAQAAEHDRPNTQNGTEARIALAAQRVRAHAERAELESAAALRLSGRTTVPLSEAVEELDEMVRASWTWPRSLGSGGDARNEINKSIWDIREALVNNPRWVRAVNIAFAAESEPSSHYKRVVGTMELELAPARDALANRTIRLAHAEADLEQWQARPEWLRTIQGWFADTEERLRQKVDAAHADVATAQDELDEVYARAEALANQAIAAEKSAHREERLGAWCDLELIETPLRAAFLEREMLTTEFVNHDVQPLSAAPHNQPLMMRGVTDAPALTFIVLESPTTTYLADWGALSEQSKNDVQLSIPGDTFHHGRSEDGASTLRLGELAPLRPGLRDFEGEVGATQHQNGQLVAFHFTDRSGCARWMKPYANDLLTELRGDTDAIRTGNHIWIENGRVRLARTPTLGVQR